MCETGHLKPASLRLRHTARDSFVFLREDSYNLGIGTQIVCRDIMNQMR